MRHAWHTLFAVALVAVTGSVRALDDPTRPPMRARVAAEVASPGEPLLILQSVIRSPNGNAAIISGRLVPVGGRIGAARLVRVTEDAAVVVANGVEKRLALYPAAQKRFGGRTQ